VGEGREGERRKGRGRGLLLRKEREGMGRGEEGRERGPLSVIPVPNLPLQHWQCG